jgi:hypothetical protein
MDSKKINDSKNIIITMFIGALMIFLILSDGYNMGIAIIPTIIGVTLIILSIIFSTVLFINWVKKTN